LTESLYTKFQFGATNIPMSGRADTLVHCNIPYSFVTSWERDERPLNQRKATVAHKPFKVAELMQAIRRLTPELRKEFA
jgi:hypothetical protein